MRAKFFSVIAILFLALAGSVAAIDATINEVQVNDFELLTGSVNNLAVTRDGQLNVDVLVTFNEDVKHTSVKAEINGVDHYDVEDESRARDYDENDTVIFNLKLDLPDDVDEDEYALEIEVADRDGSFTQTYQLRIRNPQTSVKIKDVRLFPQTIEAGDYLLTTVRVENLGEEEEDNVKVTVSVPGLNLKTSSFINEIDTDDEEDSQEMLLFIPDDAEAGQYQMIVEVLYDDRHKQTSSSELFTVLAGASKTADDTAKETGLIVVTNPAELATGSRDSLRTGLEIALLALLVILVIVALVIGFSRMKQE